MAELVCGGLEAQLEKVVACTHRAMAECAAEGMEQAAGAGCVGPDTAAFDPCTAAADDTLHAAAVVEHV